MDIHSQITKAAKETAKPTPAQSLADNYRKGRVTIKGIDIAIETPRNEYREGINPAGKPWSNLMKAHYGHFEGVKGKDGDMLDCFIGHYPESDLVWVINQKKAGGDYDESKVMLSFPDEDSAIAAYRGSYDASWDGILSIVPCTINQLKWWLEFGDTERMPTRESFPHGFFDDVHYLKKQVLNKQMLSNKNDEQIQNLQALISKKLFESL